MARAPKQLSELQLALLRVLWKAGEARITEVHAALVEARPLAQTTVATLLARLEKRGLVSHRIDGRQFVYRALVSEEEANRAMVRELADRLFTGDIPELLNHLLSEREMEPGDLARIKALIEAKERDFEAGRRPAQKPAERRKRK